jgi:hypothetical protein
MVYLDISNQGLTELHPIPEDVTWLFCGNNELTRFRQR